MIMIIRGWWKKDNMDNEDNHLQHRYTCRRVDTTTIGHNSDPLPRFGDIEVISWTIWF